MNPNVIPAQPGTTAWLRDSTGAREPHAVIAWEVTTHPVTRSTILVPIGLISGCQGFAETLHGADVIDLDGVSQASTHNDRPGW
jgi:hypothetical protein